MPKRNKTTLYKNITRFEEHSGSPGYNVRLMWNGERRSRFFSDHLHGGNDAALAAAVTWRDSVEVELGKPRTEQQVLAANPRNTSGILGVRRRERPSGPVYEATWMRVDTQGRHRKVTTCFSIARHGEEQALALAIAAKQRGEQARIAASS